MIATIAAIGDPKSGNEGMTELRIDGTVERRKITRIPKRRSDGTAKRLQVLVVFIMGSSISECVRSFESSFLSSFFLALLVRGRVPKFIRSSGTAETIFKS